MNLLIYAGEEQYKDILRVGAYRNIEQVMLQCVICCTSHWHFAKFVIYVPYVDEKAELCYNLMFIQYTGIHSTT